MSATNEQAVLFVAEEDHKLMLLPLWRNTHRGCCHCGWESLASKTTDDVDGQYRRHVEAARRKAAQA